MITERSMRRLCVKCGAVLLAFTLLCSCAQVNGQRQVASRVDVKVTPTSIALPPPEVESKQKATSVPLIEVFSTAPAAIVDEFCDLMSSDEGPRLTIQRISGRPLDELDSSRISINIDDPDDYYDMTGLLISDLNNPALAPRFENLGKKGPAEVCIYSVVTPAQ